MFLSFGCALIIIPVTYYISVSVWVILIDAAGKVSDRLLGWGWNPPCVMCFILSPLKITYKIFNKRVALDFSYYHQAGISYYAVCHGKWNKKCLLCIKVLSAVTKSNENPCSIKLAMKQSHKSRLLVYTIDARPYTICHRNNNNKMNTSSSFGGSSSKNISWLFKPSAWLIGQL